MKSETTGHPTHGEGSADGPIIRGVNNDAGAKKFKLNDGNQKVRATGQGVSDEVEVPLRSAEGSPWEPESQKAQVRYPSGQDDFLVVKSKPRKSHHPRPDDTGDLTVTVTNELSGPTAPVHQEQVDYIT